MTRILLRDVAGARDFINMLVNAAEDIAIAECGKPDHEVRARLQQLSDNLKRDLAPEIGSDAAAEVVNAFCGAVMGEKHEREALAAKSL